MQNAPTYYFCIFEQFPVLWEPVPIACHPPSLFQSSSPGPTETLFLALCVC